MLMPVVFVALSQASPQDATDDERVVVSSGGEYVSYPPRAWRQVGDVRHYEIDMSTALTNYLVPRRQLDVEMTWVADGKQDVVCFNHDDQSNCRALVLEIDRRVPPRFMPTLIDELPALYVRFENGRGQAILVEYSDGAVRAPDEWFDDFRR